MPKQSLSGNAAREALQRGVDAVANSVKQTLGAIDEGKYTDREQSAHGFNAASGEFGDLYAMGIVDPCKVVTTALTKAASVGALLLTTEVLVCDIPESK